MVLQRNAGSSSDGTEDSDFSTDLEHTDSSESDGTSRRSARVTRSSARLSQSSQGKHVFLSPDFFTVDSGVILLCWFIGILLLSLMESSGSQPS